jgi:hypothetical protein
MSTNSDGLSPRSVNDAVSSSVWWVLWWSTDEPLDDTVFGTVEVSVFRAVDVAVVDAIKGGLLTAERNDEPHPLLEAFAEKVWRDVGVK